MASVSSWLIYERLKCWYCEYTKALHKYIDQDQIAYNFNWIFITRIHSSPQFHVDWRLWKGKILCVQMYFMYMLVLWSIWWWCFWIWVRFSNIRLNLPPTPDQFKKGTIDDFTKYLIQSACEISSYECTKGPKRMVNC
jgi:hypothetical protein